MSRRASYQRSISALEYPTLMHTLFCILSIRFKVITRSLWISTLVSKAWIGNVWFVTLSIPDFSKKRKKEKVSKKRKWYSLWMRLQLVANHCYRYVSTMSLRIPGTLKNWWVICLKKLAVTQMCRTSKRNQLFYLMRIRTRNRGHSQCWSRIGLSYQSLILICWTNAMEQLHMDCFSINPCYPSSLPQDLSQKNT